MAWVSLVLAPPWGLASALAGVKVVEAAVCRPLALTGSMHTSQFVRMVLQAGGAMFESLFRVGGPGHPAFRL